MENYLESKQKLFTRLGKNDLCIINKDDPYSEKIISKTNAKIITYGLSSNSDVYPTDYNFSNTGLQAKI